MATIARPLKEDARITKSREALRRALLQLIEHRAFDEITIREITEQAGIGYATFYRHFPTKAALLDDLAAEQIRHLVGLALPVLQATNSQAACRAKFAYVDEHRSLWHALLTGGAASAVREEIIQISREVALAYLPQKPSAADELAFRLTASALVEVLTWWLERADHVSANAAADLLDRLVIAPVIRHGHPTTG